jgi:hypothetical protein
MQRQSVQGLLLHSADRDLALTLRRSAIKFCK